MKRIYYFVALILILGALTHTWKNPPTPNPQIAESLADTTIAQAYEQQLSNVPVHGLAKVTRVLPDDLKGSRHQRLIVTLDSGRTLLIAHNIDLAPKIHDAQPGDALEFKGLYEWNSKGGVVHWTHHDPNNKWEGGWIKYKGKVFQ